MLEFVDSDLYFVQDKNNFINPLLQVGSGSVKKRTGSGWPKIAGSDRIRILIPGYSADFLFSTFSYFSPFIRLSAGRFVYLHASLFVLSSLP